MDDALLVTFGCLMGLEAESKQDPGADDISKEVLLVFCSTRELGEGTIEVTPRMKDLAFMGFRAVAIARGDPEDVSQFAIFATDDLSDSMRTAVFQDSAKIVLESLDSSVDMKWDHVETNTNKCERWQR